MMPLGLEATEVRCRGRAFRNGTIDDRAVALRHVLCHGQGMQANRRTWAQIGQVKEKISSEKGWEASQQKLIYSGMHRRRTSCYSFANVHVGRADHVPYE